MLHLKFKSADYGRVLLCSDFHDFHKRDFIYEPRGFKSWEEHSEFIHDQIASLDSKDLVFALGDMFLNCSPEQAESVLDSFPCETYLINGNHPAGVKQAYKKAYAAAGYPAGGEFFPLKIAKNVTHLGDDFELDVDRHRLYCRHYAPLLWDGINKGRNCCCGHSHSSLKAANPNENGIGRVLDVGVDNAIKYNGTAFFNINEVAEIMERKGTTNLDHHA